MHYVTLSHLYLVKCTEFNDVSLLYRASVLSVRVPQPVVNRTAIGQCLNLCRFVNIFIYFNVFICPFTDTDNKILFKMQQLS